MKKVLEKFENPTEFLCLIVILVVAVYFFIGSFQFFDGDEIFPRLTSAATIICTLTYMIISLTKKNKNTSAKKDESFSDKEKKGASEFHVLLASLLFIGYFGLVWFLGFVVATVIFIIAYPIIFGYKKILSIVILLIVNLGFVLLFQKLTGVSLSKGVFLDLTSWFF